MNISTYAKYPTPEEWDVLYRKKEKSLDKIKFEVKKGRFNVFDLFSGDNGIVLNSVLLEFNNRSFDLANNYVMLMSYFNAGIPDDEWYISPGRDGSSIQYFPHFEEEHHIYHYWFGFYMESYYTRFSGMIDAVYHLINIKYNFEIEPGLGFIGKILKKLEVADKDLHDYLKSVPQNPIYEKTNEFRNDLTHNFRPNQVDSGFERRINSDGNEEISMTTGNYTKSSEFVRNIEESIDLLAEITEEIRAKIIS